MIELSADKVKLAETVMRGSPEKITKMFSQVVNRVADGVKTDAIRKTRANYNIKAESARGQVQVKKGSAGNIGAIIRAQGPAIPLSKFKVTPARPTPGRTKPIYAQVKKGGGGELKKAFVIRAQNGHIGVMSRVGTARLPLRQHYGPSVPQMLGNQEVTQHIEQQAQERMDKRFEHEINRYLRGINI